MHVTGHALRGRNLIRELMLDGMARLVLLIFKLLVVGRRRAAVAERGPDGTRIDDASVVRVDDVTGGAARRAVVAGVIVRAEEVERRVEESRLLQTEVDGGCAVERSESARAQALVG